MSLISPNDKTIEVYELRAADYIAKTPPAYTAKHRQLLEWLDFSLGLLRPNSDILEIGSGSGRESNYIKSKGFNVTATDATHAFVSHLLSHGHNSYSLNVLKDPILGTYDMILANAVLPHFTIDDVTLTLRKVRDALKPGGVFAFSLKQGVGDSWINEKFHEKRFVHYWSASDIRNILKDEGYEILFLAENIPGDISTHTWMDITVKKAIQTRSGYL